MGFCRLRVLLSGTISAIAQIDDFESSTLSVFKLRSMTPQDLMNVLLKPAIANLITSIPRVNKFS